MYVIFISIVLGVSLIYFGIEMQITKELSNASTLYINSYAGYAIQSGIVELAGTSHVVTEENTIVLTANNTGASTIQDALASTNYYAARTEPTVNYFKLTYNLPTFFVLTLGLDLFQFAGFLNSAGIIIFIGLLAVVFKIMRGS